MVGAFRAILASLMSLLSILPLAQAGPRAPDLSGRWVLLAASAGAGSRTSGRGSAAQANGEPRTITNTVSGAAFNCGRECTIVHKGQILRIEAALLASNTTPAGVVTLHLDGRQRTAIDSFGPPRQIPVRAAWNGDKVEIASVTGSHTITQVVSVEGGQLVVVTSVDIDGSRPETFRYKRQ